MRVVVSLLLVLVLSACSSSHVVVGEHDGGGHTDASLADASLADASLADASRDDASTPIDGGWCECPAPPPGCEYVGVPCPCTALVCDDAGTERSCGGLAGFTCTDAEFCDYPDEAMCGITDGGGTCQPRPTACPFTIDPHCGCDGVTYSNECAANYAGVDVLSRGECGSEPCAPDDARGNGFCDAIVGVAWNGHSCVRLSGCSCVGTDCGRYESLEDCEAAHATCPVPL